MGMILLSEKLLQKIKSYMEVAENKNSVTCERFGLRHAPVRLKFRQIVCAGHTATLCFFKVVNKVSTRFNFSLDGRTKIFEHCSRELTLLPMRVSPGAGTWTKEQKVETILTTKSQTRWICSLSTIINVVSIYGIVMHVYFTFAVN